MNLTAPPNTTHSIPYETSIFISFYTVSLVQVVECPPTYLCVDSNKNSRCIPSALPNISPPPPETGPPQPPPPPLFKLTLLVKVPVHMGFGRLIHTVSEGNKYKTALVQVVE